jgi:transcription antitermination protein NusB
LHKVKIMAEKTGPIIMRRNKAREVALQLLFMKDYTQGADDFWSKTFARERLPDTRLIPFALELYHGVLEHKDAIDATLMEAADNWRLPRMAGVDRNVLRMGAYEMFFQKEPTPAPVAMNEAIELARRFGSKDSPNFVNGVLDKVYKSKTTPVVTPEAEPTPAVSTPVSETPPPSMLAE